MGVINGQAVSAEVTNPAFVDANADDTDTGKLDFANTAPESGPTVSNIQREVNSLDAFTGRPAGSAYNATPSWTNNDVGSSTDTVKTRADDLTQKFNATTGHEHTGAAGDAPAISGPTLSNVPLKGYVQQGTDLVAVTGTSTDVSTQLAGKTASTGITVTGVVVTNPVNEIVIRQASGANQGDNYTDAFGNVVYGRLTYSTPTFTLSYYVNIAGIETAYTFAASDVRWYYQELFNPMVNPPTYSEYAIIPSDNVTADVVPATTGVQGKVLLSSTAAAPVGSSGTIGTTNATVANADHVHQGVHSINGGSSNLFGDVIIAGAGGSAASQSGQTVTVTSPDLSSTAPADVGSTAAVGTGTTTARADHVHVGVHSIAKSGSSPIVGDATFTGTGGTTLTQVGQNIQISSTSGTTSPLTTKGDVWGYSSTDARIPIGSNGQVLTADSTQTLGLKWAPPTTYTPPVTTKGDLFTYSTVPDKIGVGADNQVLVADSTQSTGLKWANQASASSSPIAAIMSFYRFS